MPRRDVSVFVDIAFLDVSTTHDGVRGYAGYLLWEHLYMTLRRVLFGVVIGIAVGVLLGLLGRAAALTGVRPAARRGRRGGEGSGLTG